MALQDLDDRCVMMDARREMALSGAVGASTTGLEMSIISTCSEDGLVENGGDGLCGLCMRCSLRARRTGVSPDPAIQLGWALRL